jgi:hypothetical protein
MTTSKKIRIFIILLLFFCLLGAFAFWVKQKEKEIDEEVLSLTDQTEVEVTARIYGCLFEITAYPEKRIPRIGNWSTILSLDLNSPTTNQSLSFQVTTNSQGYATTDLCAIGFTPETGTFNLYLRGYSHLRKQFTNIDLFTYILTTLAFTNDNQQLLAGETSVIFDNKINSLDVSTQVNNLYTNSYKNDLNQDGKVNSLDLSNTSYNLYLTGD